MTVSGASEQNCLSMVVSNNFDIRTKALSGGSLFEKILAPTSPLQHVSLNRTPGACTKNICIIYIRAAASGKERVLHAGS